MDTQDTHRALLKLVGKSVVVGLHEGVPAARAVNSSSIKGKVANAMFDSFLVETSSGNHVIRFEDVAFIDET